MLGWLKRAFRPQLPAPVIVDEAGARRQLSDGATEGVLWGDVVRIEIITTDEGPFVEDVFWRIDAGDHGCVIPGEFGQQVLDQIEEFPGLDFEAVIQAMGCTTSSRFLIWERPDGVSSRNST